MRPALEQLQNALRAFYHPRNSDSGQRYRGQLALWKKLADRLVEDYAAHWSDDDVASVIRELAAYAAFLTRTKPTRIAKLGEPSAAQHLPTLNRLYNGANSRPGHVPFRLEISLDQLKTACEATGPGPEYFGAWRGELEALMGEKASSWSPADVQAIANELAVYGLELHSAVSSLDGTLPEFGTPDAEKHLPILNKFYMEEEEAHPSRIQLPVRARRSASPADEERGMRRRSPARGAHDQRSLARSMMGHPHYKLERLRPF